MDTQITINNAGLVLANSFIKMLFERLDFIENSQLNASDKEVAPLYLQYLVTGLNQTEESFLPLNKILCGLDIAAPVPNSVEISDEDKTLMDGLINAMINYWSGIGDMSIDGFRGNWFVRDGVLTEGDNGWHLTVEKRSYDILINKSPFSFSIISYPWMEKPLYVTWPY